MAEPQEFSESGAPIYRHESRPRSFERAATDPDRADRIARHVEEHLGKVSLVLHEVLSDLVHIDVHLVAPTPERNFYTLVTSGMSLKPMNPPEGLSECRYAELMISLPPEWQLSETTEFADETIYWPVRWLKRLARFPHEFNTWLFWGHTVPNGDPPRPFASNTQMDCMLLLEPNLVPQGFRRLNLPSGEAVHFFALYPLYPEEVAFKLKEGVEMLQARLRQEGVSELLRVDRSSVCARNDADDSGELATGEEGEEGSKDQAHPTPEKDHLTGPDCLG